MLNNMLLAFETWLLIKDSERKILEFEKKVLVGSDTEKIAPMQIE